MKSCTVDRGCTPAPKDATKLAVFFRIFRDFLWHFNKKQRAEVIFRLSRPVSCKNQENDSRKQWSLHAPLNSKPCNKLTLHMSVQAWWNLVHFTSALYYFFPIFTLDIQPWVTLLLKQCACVCQVVPSTKLYTRARMYARTHTHMRACRGGYFEMFNVLGGHFKYSTVSVVFPLASLLSSLYWPWDPLSSLESTPVSI